ncbi:hypothetical protein ACVW0J_005875 [Bradyrhizobium sp. i1.7.7]
MLPDVIGCSALMQRISVDLPDPDGPMIQITSLFLTDRLMPFRTSRAPNDFLTSTHWTMG